MTELLPVALIMVGGGTIAVGGLLSTSSRTDARGDTQSVWQSAPISAGVRQAAGAVVLGVIGVVLGIVVSVVAGFSFFLALPVCGLLGLCGALIPRARADRAERNRLRAADRDTASFAGLLAIELRSGLGVDAAIENVANELDGVLPDEVQTMTMQVRLGMARSRALELLRERLPAPNVERLVQALGHAGELGAPVAETLDKLADDCTTRQFQQVREEAAKLPVKMLFPVLFCIFPPMLMVLAGPAMVSIAAAFG
jgi:tight adherence protein C